MAKISGDKRFSKRLRSLSGHALVEEISREVFVAADKIRAEAQASIARGSVQGKGHQPSKPGTPPNLDTGVLTAGIVAHPVSPLRAVVESTAVYAAAQEFGHDFGGGRVLPERPYMRPAAKKVRKEYQVDVARAVNRAIRKG